VVLVRELLIIASEKVTLMLAVGEMPVVLGLGLFPVTVGRVASTIMVQAGLDSAEVLLAASVALAV
jgi:hypothetical protein